MVVFRSLGERQLESLTRAGSTPRSLARKGAVILLGVPRVPNHAIAQQTGLSRPTGSPRGALKLSAPLSDAESIAASVHPGVRAEDVGHHSERPGCRTGTSGACACSPARWAFPACPSGESGTSSPIVWRSLRFPTIRRFDQKVGDGVGLCVNSPDRALVLASMKKARFSEGSHRSRPDFATRFAGTADP